MEYRETESGRKEIVHRRIFRFLVRLFPIEFRWDYGRDMEHVFCLA